MGKLKERLDQGINWVGQRIIQGFNDVGKLPFWAWYRMTSGKKQATMVEIKRLIEKINALEADTKAETDKRLALRTQAFKLRLAQGESLDDLLPEAFATVREAAWRTLGQRPFDVQLQGAIMLHRGMVAEMKTGEGKTLVSTCAIYLNALTGKGVHVVTINEYLASRDANWMGVIYRFLGLSVGCIFQGLTDQQRQEAYSADITYATNSELGFDYLKDNMKFSKEYFCQRPFAYAIIDEVDSILIDEARTPLIISGPSRDASDLYLMADAIVARLQPHHYEKDAKTRGITFTENGIDTLEQLLRQEGGLSEDDGLYGTSNMALVHHMNQALKARHAFTRDVDYIVHQGKVVIIDEFTGRMMEGRRYSDGLHQALEAKENVDIEPENQTLASITLQNYFRLYPKLAGMTGTAMTEAEELKGIYNLDVWEVPTHRPVQRQDYDDEIYRTEAEKIEAVIRMVKKCHTQGQPVLVGTISIEKSEMLSQAFKQQGIPHDVLNARNHEREADIIAMAGIEGAVTIATNMAGRGTDIKLGGNFEVEVRAACQGIDDPEELKRLTELIRKDVSLREEKLKALGGLCVIGTERHESRRIDNQLRGRSGRQGDPGISQFFISLEDELMRRFGGARLDSLLTKMGLKQGEAVTHPLVTRALERAQKRVEAQNYDMRKHLLRYDDVMNAQRKLVYKKRRDILWQPSVSDDIHIFQEEVLAREFQRYAPAQNDISTWDLTKLRHQLENLGITNLPWDQFEAHEIVYTDFSQAAYEAAEKGYQNLRGQAESLTVSERVVNCERLVMLRTLDFLWKEHLYALDHIREGIHLRAYGQTDPLMEYRRIAFDMFDDLWQTFQYQTLQRLQDALGDLIHEPRYDLEALEGDDEMIWRLKSEAIPTRNSPCPCGSGQRFKECHGALTRDQ